MKTFRINIWQDGEYKWPQAFGFTPFLTAYLHDDKTSRPCILVVPGGAYYVVSPTEAGIVALDFYQRGYNTFVITYTTNLLGTIALKEQPMNDLARAIRLIRSQSDELFILPDKLTVCGFSAGGHLSASVGVHFSDIAEKNPIYSPYSARPDALILSYPVITTGRFTHEGSVINLLGRDCSEEELKYMSLETCVTKDTPPSFIWQTASDELVPAENSYLFASACKMHSVPFAHHVFSQGPHGLSLATAFWAEGLYGKLYTLEPFRLTINAIESGSSGITVSNEKLAMLKAEFSNHAVGNPYGREANPEVSIWPALADSWLKSTVF